MSPIIIDSYRFGATAGPPTAPADAANLVIWLRSDQGIYTDTGLTTPATANGDEVKGWADLSGNNNHAIRQATHSGALLRPSAINGLNALEFLSSGVRNYTLPNIFTGFSSGEIFIVLKADADPSAGSDGSLWLIDTAAPFGSFWPYTDGTVYECFGSTTQKNTGNPAFSLSSTYRVYNVYSAASDYQTFFDGVSFYSTATNTVGWSTAPVLGAQVNNGLTWSGRMAEVLIYQHKLSGGDRTTVTAYLGARYGLF